MKNVARTFSALILALAAYYRLQIQTMQMNRAMMRLWRIRAHRNRFVGAARNVKGE